LSANNSTTISNEKVKDFLLNLLAYTSGHMFPFFKLAEYIFTEHADNVIDGTFVSEYRGSTFTATEVYARFDNGVLI